MFSPRSFLLFLAVFCFTGCAHGLTPRRVSQGPVLSVRIGKREIHWSRSELLRMPNLKKVVISRDPTYGTAVRSFLAIRVSKLFEKVATHEMLARLIREHSALEFNCLDGFSANLPLALVLNSDRKNAVAYIAIESPAKKWPPLQRDGKTGEKSSASAGPFYLIWKHAARSRIGPEEWPYQLKGFVVETSADLRFPNIVPQTRNKNVLAGFRLFKQNCFMCHTMNGDIGDGIFSITVQHKR